MSKRIATVTKRVERAANVSDRRAIDELLKAYPGSRIASFERKGNKFIAQIAVPQRKTAFPGDSVDPALDVPEAPDAPLDMPADDPMLDDGGVSVEDRLTQIETLVQQIADAVGVVEDPLAETDDAVDEVPLEDDADAEPIAAEDAEPKMAKHEHFDRVASRESFQLEHEAAAGLDAVDIIREATAAFPGFRVAKLDTATKAADGIAIIDMVKKQG